MNINLPSANSRQAPVPSLILPLMARQVHAGDYYFLDLAPDPASNLTVVFGGREACGTAYRVDRTDFPYHALEYVVSGRGVLVIQGVTVPLRAGSIFCYGPGVAHHIHADGRELLLKHFIDFVGIRAQALLAASPLGGHHSLQVAEPARIQERFEDLLHTGQRQRETSQRLCGLLLEMLILQLHELAVPQKTIDSMSWATYQNCRARIETNFIRMKDLSEVATTCHVSEPYICRVFKRYHPCSPYQYLIQMKMAHAAALLVNQNLLIKEVACRVFIDDPYHFSRLFKGVYGLSPESFRRRSRQDFASSTTLKNGSGKPQLRDAD